MSVYTIEKICAKISGKICDFLGEKSTTSLHEKFIFVDNRKIRAYSIWYISLKRLFFKLKRL